MCTFTRPLLLAAMCLTLQARAALTQTDTLWLRGGLPISVEQGDQRYPLLAPDGAGGAVLAWTKEPFQGSNIRVTRLTFAGDSVPGWSAHGMALCPASNAQFDLALAPDGAGGAFFAWMDFRGGFNWNIYAQHLAGAGTPAPGWAAEGVPVCIDSAIQQAPTIAPDGFGGAFVAWVDARDLNPDIYLHHINASGALDSNWPSNGRAVCTAPYTQDRPELVPDGSGGVFVEWNDSRESPGSYSPRPYLQHMTSDASIAPGWLPNGIPITTFGSVEIFGILSDGAGGVVFGFPNSGPYPSVIYAQRITGSGTVAPGWPVGGTVLRQTNGAIGWNAFVSDGAGGAIAAWVDERSGGMDIYAQRVSAGGSVPAPWPANGAPVCTAAATQNQPEAVEDAAGGALIWWWDLRIPSIPASYALRITGDGSAALGWPTDGIVLFGRWPETGVPDGASGAIFAWSGPGSAGDGIYAGRITDQGVVAAELSLVGADALADRVLINWFSTAAEFQSARVERSEGSGDWSIRGTVRSDGSGYLRFEDLDVRPGRRYGYRLMSSGGGAASPAGEVWVLVPSAVRLALDGLRPNPSGARPLVSLVLADASPARLEIFDLQGRAVLVRDLEGLGPGRHLVQLGHTRLAPGIYLMRLRSAGRVVTARGCVLE